MTKTVTSTATCIIALSLLATTIVACSAPAESTPTIPSLWGRSDPTATATPSDALTSEPSPTATATQAAANEDPTPTREAADDERPGLTLPDTPTPTPVHTQTVAPEIRVINPSGIDDARDIQYSPDGSKIAFTSNRDGDPDIYVMDADGSNIQRLTGVSDDDYQPAWSSDGSKIAFTSDRDGDPDIFVMNADGSDQTRITNSGASDTNAAWAPDGSKIAFQSTRDDGNWNIFTMNSDGSDIEQVTDTNAADTAPAWSPDGAKIAFTSTRDGDPDIFVMNADGSDTTRITNSTAADTNPAWAPDGSKIAFQSDRDGSRSVFIANPDGTDITMIQTQSADTSSAPTWSPNGNAIAFLGNDGNIVAATTDGLGIGEAVNELTTINLPAATQTPTPITLNPTATPSSADPFPVAQITDNDYFQGSLSWSPDGSKIAFRTIGERVSPLIGDLYIMDADGSNATLVADDDFGTFVPEWSPDGSKIAFSSFRDGDPEIYIMDADGSNVSQITDSAAHNFNPDWSPDGSKIAFSSFQDGDGEENIYVMDADGSNLTQLTDNDYGEISPKWSPDGTKIAFSSDRDGDGDIYVMDADGSDVTRITYASGEIHFFFAWSPDSTKIAFSSDRDGDGDREIQVVNADGSNLMQFVDDDYDDTFPSWSPDGTKIAFASAGYVDREIRVINADGSNLVQITDGYDVRGLPAWSPDGSKIAFFAVDLIIDGDLHVADVSSLGIAPAQPFIPVPAKIDTGSPETDRAALTALYNATNGSRWEYFDNGDRQKVANWLIGEQLSEWEGVEVSNGRVVKLDLAGFGLTGQLPAVIGDLAKLRELQLSLNNLSGDIPSEIGNLVELEKLYLSYNSFTGGIPDAMGNLTELKQLSFSYNDLSGNVPSGISNLRGLEGLRLRGNSLTGRIPQTISELNHLVDLDITGNDLSGELPVGIANLAELEKLNLAWNSLSLTTQRLEEIGNLPKLQALTLAGNDLDGCVPSRLRPEPQKNGDIPDRHVPANDVIFTGFRYCDEEDQTPRPLADYPEEFVELKIGYAVSDFEWRAAHLGLYWLHLYAQRNNWPITRDRVEVYVDVPSSLEDACLWRLRARGKLRSAYNCDVNVGKSGFATLDFNFNKASEVEDQISLHDLQFMSHVVIHENIHSSFQKDVLDGNPELLPKWFSEGMAQYFAAHVVGYSLPWSDLAYRDNGWFESKRKEWVSEAKEDKNPLSSYETTAPPKAYYVGPLAIEFLASQTSWEQIPEFFETMRNAPTWQSAFRETFGMDVADFYRDFAEHKKHGFKFNVLPRAPEQALP